MTLIKIDYKNHYSLFIIIISLLKFIVSTLLHTVSQRLCGFYYTVYGRRAGYVTSRADRLIVAHCVPELHFWNMAQTEKIVRPKSSSVWEQFTLNSNEKCIVCKLCKINVAWYGSATVMRELLSPFSHGSNKYWTQQQGKLLQKLY